MLLICLCLLCCETRGKCFGAASCLSHELNGECHNGSQIGLINELRMPNACLMPHRVQSSLVFLHARTSGVAAPPAAHTSVECPRRKRGFLTTRWSLSDSTTTEHSACFRVFATHDVTLPPLCCSIAYCTSQLSYIHGWERVYSHFLPCIPRVVRVSWTDAEQLSMKA